MKLTSGQRTQDFTNVPIVVASLNLEMMNAR